LPCWVADDEILVGSLPDESVIDEHEGGPIDMVTGIDDDFGEGD